jgi:hypothetical protein
MKSKLLTPLDGNIRVIKFFWKWHKQKLEKASESFDHANWTSNDFATKLNLIVIGLDPHKDLLQVVLNEKVIFVFGA